MHRRVRGGFRCIRQACNSCSTSAHHPTWRTPPSSSLLSRYNHFQPLPEVSHNKFFNSFNLSLLSAIISQLGHEKNYFLFVTLRTSEQLHLFFFRHKCSFSLSSISIIVIAHLLLNKKKWNSFLLARVDSRRVIKITIYNFLTQFSKRRVFISCICFNNSYLTIIEMCCTNRRIKKEKNVKIIYYMKTRA